MARVRIPHNRTQDKADQITNKHKSTLHQMMAVESYEKDYQKRCEEETFRQKIRKYHEQGKSANWIYARLLIEYRQMSNGGSPAKIIEHITGEKVVINDGKINIKESNSTKKDPKDNDIDER